MKNKFKGSSGFLIVLIIAFFVPTGSAFAETLVPSPNHKEIKVTELDFPAPDTTCYQLHAKYQHNSCGEKFSTWVVEIKDEVDPEKDVVRMLPGKRECGDVAKTPQLSPSTLDLTISVKDEEGESKVKVQDLTGITILGAQDEVVWLRYTDLTPPYCNQICYYRWGHKVCWPQ